MKKFAAAAMFVLMSAAAAFAEVPVWRILWITLPKLNVNHDGTQYTCEMTEWEINKEHELAYDVEKFIEDASGNTVDVQITLFDSAMEVTTLTDSNWLFVDYKDFPEDVNNEIQRAKDKGHPYNFKFITYKLDGDSDKINSYGGLGGGTLARARAGFYWNELYLLDVRLHELLHCFDWFYESLLGYPMPGTHNAEQWGYTGGEEAANEFYHDTYAFAVRDESNDRYIGISPEMWQYHPGNTHQYNGHTYQFFTISASWEDAKDYCEALGGHLVSITSSGEQAMIETFMKISDKSGWSDTVFWAGGNKASDSWEWTTGENFSYTNFTADSESGDNYLQLKAWDKGGAWKTSDGLRKERTFFICEWDCMRGDLKLEPTVTTSSLPDANLKSEYYKQLYSAGSEPITWKAVGLPKGLSCNVSGEITGQPELEGTYHVTVAAYNSEGQYNKSFFLTVRERLGAELNTTNFPDDSFREYLSANFDKDGDEWLDTSEISAVTNIDVRGTESQKGGIYSLKGIEYFTSLETLHCEYNGLTDLDLSKNTRLSWLECQHNEIETLNISGCSSLWVLICGSNKITRLDVSICPNVNYINCGDNRLSRLYTGKNTGLSVLLCGTNNLSSLNLAANENLTWLACSHNSLTLLDLSNNSRLTHLYCDNNKLEWLNIDNCPELLKLYCYSNNISALNIGGCTKRDSSEWNFYHDSNTEITYTHVDAPGKPVITKAALPYAVTGEQYAFQFTASGGSAEKWTSTRLPDGLNLASDTGTISGIPSRAGKFTITVKAANSYGYSKARFALQIFIPASITTASLKSGTVNKTYSVALKAKGSKPLTWSAEGLPSGLTINAKTGRISGRPSVSGTFSVKVVASNPAGSTEKTLQLTVKGAAPKLSGNLARATLNVPYSSGLKLTAGSLPVTWSITGTLPEGLSFDTETGIISGIPASYSKSGYKLTITASNDAGKKSKKVTLKVNAASARNKTSRLQDAPAERADSGLTSGLYADSGQVTGIAAKQAGGYIVVAELGEISCDMAGMYDFTVLLSDDVPEGTELVYLANSDAPSEDDDIAEFLDDTGEEISCVPESRKITVSVWLNEGVVYRPEIAVRK